MFHVQGFKIWMDLREKKVLVVGIGKSGLSACRWLSRQGASVTVSEMKAWDELHRDVRAEMEGLGVRVETGGHREETFLKAGMIIVSPGVPLDIGPLEAARKRGIPILGEMELAGRVIDIPIVAVTGTNGKSTATAFLGAMAERAGLRAFVGGNIGTPLMDYAVDNPAADVAVVEVSSFQLDTMETFCPAISLLLNISPDHLDRYPDYEAYVKSKLRIFQNQGPGHYAILNDDDERLNRFHPAGGVTVLRYGSEKRGHRHAFMEEGRLKAALPGQAFHEFHVEGFRLPGRHNLENLMGAVLAGLALQMDPSGIQETIGAFPGLPHRIEPVGRVMGVDFYNDSKATNVDAASRSVAGFDRPVILIAGGRHKGADYAPLVRAARGRVRKAVFLGEAKDLLAEAFEGEVPFTLAEDMADAVSRALSAALPNDVVLLAPACSSFDMFTDYGHRGRVFRDAVEKLNHG